MASVLVVVAEEGVGRRIAWVLTEEGYAVHAAHSAGAALKDAAATQPDAIIVNSVVPPEQLPELVQQLRRAAPGAALVDILQPAGGAPLPVDTDASLTQPFHADDLVRELENAIERSAAQGSSL